MSAADREPPDKPVKILPADVIRTRTQFDRTPFRRNKWGHPDLRALHGNHFHGPLHAITRAYHTIHEPPTHMQGLLSTKDKCRFHVCMDSGCTISVTPSLDDFEAPPIPGDYGFIRQVNGEATPIKALGFTRWHVTDTNGDSRIFRTPAYYIPEANQRLMSPQSYAQFHGWKGSKGCYHGHDRDMWVELALPHENGPVILNAAISKADNLPYFVATLDSCQGG